jgi:hypothetical protein
MDSPSVSPDSVCAIPITGNSFPEGDILEANLYIPLLLNRNTAVHSNTATIDKYRNMARVKNYLD